jgi:plastocyanin
MTRRSIMKTRNRALALAFISAAIFTAAVSAGCGESTALDPTPVKTWKITPAATQPGAVETVAPTEAPPETPAPPADGTPGAGTVLEIAAISSTFDRSEMEAPAGSITIKYDNRDAGVIHNISLFLGEDASGEFIDATELESGPIEQELTVELEPGTYFYQCDSHPTTMKGTLTVS